MAPRWHSPGVGSCPSPFIPRGSLSFPPSMGTSGYIQHRTLMSVSSVNGVGLESETPSYPMKPLWFLSALSPCFTGWAHRAGPSKTHMPEVTLGRREPFQGCQSQSAPASSSCRQGWNRVCAGAQPPCITQRHQHLPWGYCYGAVLARHSLSLIFSPCISGVSGAPDHPSP